MISPTQNTNESILMYKKAYTSPVLKTILLAPENIICASGEKDITIDNKDSYGGEFDSSSHTWDSSNWSDADSDE